MPCLQASIRLVLSIGILFCFDHLMVFIEVWIYICCLHQHCTSLSAPKLIFILIHEYSITTYTVYRLSRVVPGRFNTTTDLSVFLPASIEVSRITMRCCPYILSTDIGMMFFKTWNSNPLYSCADSQNVPEDWRLPFDMTLVISR